MQEAAQTQVPSCLRVLATMQLFNMGFQYVAWSSVAAQGGLPAPNAGIKACASEPPMQLSVRHHPGNNSSLFVLKCKGNHFWVHPSPCLTGLFPGAQYTNANLWPQKGWLHCCLREESSIYRIGMNFGLLCHNSGSFSSVQVLHMCMQA